MKVYGLVLRKSLLATSIRSQYGFGLHINSPGVEGIREDSSGDEGSGAVMSS